MPRPPEDPASPDRIPAAEWRAPEPAPPLPGSLAARLAAARTGFLRYAVAGGAIMGAFASTFATGAEGRTEISGTMVIGTFVGFGVGMVLGWTTFRIVERAAGDATPRQPVASVVAFGLALPAYVLAGVVASVASALVREMPAAGIAALVPDVLRLLVFSGLFLLPIAVAFGRSDRTRPTTLREALSQGEDLTANPTRLSRTFWGIAVALVMLVASLMATFALMGIVQSFAPGAFEWLARFDGANQVLLLGTWILIGVGGWTLTMRFIDRLRRRGA